MLLRKKIFGFLICFSPLFSMTSFGAQQQAMQEDVFATARELCKAKFTAEQGEVAVEAHLNCRDFTILVDRITGKPLNLPGDHWIEISTVQKEGKKNQSDASMVYHALGFDGKTCNNLDVLVLKAVQQQIPVLDCDLVTEAWVREKCTEKAMSACSSLISEIRNPGSTGKEEASSSDQKQTQSQKQAAASCKVVAKDSLNTCDFLHHHFEEPAQAPSEECVADQECAKGSEKTQEVKDVVDQGCAKAPGKAQQEAEDVADQDGKAE